MLDLTNYLKSGVTNVSNLLLDHYLELEMTDSELVFYLKILQNQQNGILFPDLVKLSAEMGKPQETLFQLLQSLMSKGCITLITEQNAAGQTIDAYDTTVVFDKLDKLSKHEMKKNTQLEKNTQIQELYRLFEQEFGRPLSPIELETIGQWLKQDNYHQDIIRLALREAVLNQAYSLKYIDRILLSWERKNLTTKDQVLKDQKARQKNLKTDDRQIGGNDTQQLPKVPLYNWLDPKS